MTEVLPARAERIAHNALAGEMVLRRLLPEDESRVRDILFYDPEQFLAVGEMVEYIEHPDRIGDWIAGTSSDDIAKRHTKFGVRVGGTMPGCVGYRLPGNSTADIWYLVGKEHIGHGYATTGVALLKGFLSGQGIETFRAYILPENIASRKTAEKSGFKYEGIWDCNGRGYLRYIAMR